MVGHEFNTPMNGILSFSKMIRENAQKWDDKELVDFCDYLDKSSQRLHQTFNKVKLLLELQQVGTQVQPSTEKSFNTENIITRVSNDIAVRSNRKADIVLQKIDPLITAVD